MTQTPEKHRPSPLFLPSALRPLPLRSAFTLIEMLTTVAVLVILLGVVGSLARGVRDRSAQVLTRQLLKQLDGLMAQYIEHNGGQLPPVELLLPDEPLTRPGPPPPPPDEAALAVTARRNN